MKQKPINAFFGGSAKKDTEPPKSTQRKISAFFGNGVKAELTPGPVANGPITPGAAVATPPPGPSNGAAAAAAAPAARLSLDPGLMTDDALPGPSSEPAAAEAAKGATPALVRPTAVKAPAGGSTSKPKAPSSSAAAADARGPPTAVAKPVKDQAMLKAKSGGGKAAKAKPNKTGKSSGGGPGARKRLRRVVMEDDEEGGGAVEDGLEDDDVGGDQEQLEDSDYEGASESGSDEAFSAEEEEESEEEEDEAAESDGDDVTAAIGKKRKRPPTKVVICGSCEGIGAGVGGVGGGVGGSNGGGKSAVTSTPCTVAPGSCGGAGVGRSGGGGLKSIGGGGNMATPSSARSGKSALAETPSKSQGGSELTLGVAASMEGEAARFADRMAVRFSFLHPDNIRDANQRRPDHPEYDPRTLYIPPGWFKEFKISEGQQQWWNFKAHNFDSVLLFKMGKFYEMFEMDAYVGVEVLGLTFMRGEQPHAGFPEVKYADMAESLARAGYRVVVVEQVMKGTETPEMLAKRNEQRRMQGKKQANVVDRQKVAVLSRGTLVDAEMVASRPDASYVLAVAEMDVGGDEQEAAADKAAGAVRIGLCAVDAASGQVLVGEFVDDEVRSTLRTQLTALQPQELVLPRKALSATTSHVLRNGVRDPRVNSMRGPAGDWSAEKTYRALRDAEYFTASSAAPAATSSPAAAQGGAYGTSEDMEVDGCGQGAAAPGATRSSRPDVDPSKRWPQLLRRIVSDGVSSRPAAMAALGGMIAFLKDSLLDRAVLPLGRFEELPALVASRGSAGAGEDSSGADVAGAEGPLYMALNGAALENLEILENSDGGSAGTLLSVLDNCATPFGRRRLRQWLCRPLGRIPDIQARQDAVAQLCGELAEAVGQARKLLASVSDLERAVARLHASTVSGASGRDAANVVLYEDAGKRRVAALTSVLKDLRAAHGALSRLREAMQGGGGGSELLRRIVFDRCRPAEVSSALEALEGATDWKEAAATGRAVPEQVAGVGVGGVDEEYDAAMEAVDTVERKMQDYLKELRQRFGRDVNLVSVNKDSHLVEVPDSVAGKLGGEFHLVGNRKGYKRFTGNRLKALVADLDRVMERKEAVLSSILTRLLVKFVSHKALWVAVVEAVADLDALMSLAAHAMSPPDGGPMCRPKLVPPAARDSAAGKTGDSEPSGATFDAVAMRHPAGISGRNNGAFVPNDVRLGRGGSCGGAPPFILLSGPNMGGKSTLLRQVCLATVLAQIGACVPAESLTLSPADAIFVRMGARDAIMTGQSTFFIELAETAAMLAKATSDSLVALDELGRGTATLDGAAVAGAVLQHLATVTGCRGLFATHYHHLSDEHANDPQVAVMHMACAVEGAADGEEAATAPSSVGNGTGGAGASSGAEEVTFLYRLTPGACPKSYGTNVARLAGLPPKVVIRAAEVSAQWNQDQKHREHPLRAPSGSEPGQERGDAMEVDGQAAARSAGSTVAAAAAVDLRALVSEVQGWRSRNENLDIAQLRQLQAAAAKLIGASP
ncbi:hypothetical protein VOLCADRAFT_105835 [Volvox carteri f. nagariensis]|uniref:DNA mismatch repair protein n=1 Tax=Volvox carteri f. nagariensis TaxID=3068 RepID=D8U3H0_VOLCA|nr:uncharacterized protein VOLCADRAFT_105835 [Volvox carteri f. nagariensis]EFJ45822.1 hypothetical protein VOLCADRAFT_105835 [Volvox carteri f. nagariensis]|eukprot:XP_002953223.1 hypothetical protein VOLCADRAFT_105835 [Volvox carteri f. nagariensis]